jgi:UDP-N-acetylglucosamine 2-epimerase (non-hydrolysing)
MEICCVVGARPNFMKIGPAFLEFRRRGWNARLIHTGQHYDKNMSDVFFDDLGLPEPDVFLNVGSDTHARQTARVMMGFEDVVRANRPDLVVVAGDVNSTVAAAIVAAKECIPLAHIESGLRSFDRSMPEEINRVVTDHLSDFLFTTEKGANTNLESEGIDSRCIHFVGNCMVDSLQKHLNRAIEKEPWKRFEVKCHEYALVTIHRPSNVDDLKNLVNIVETLNEVARLIPVVFPLHPRTRAKLAAENLQCAGGVKLCEPLPYLDFLGLMARARIVMTDSGGIQEETTALRIPCLTLRHNTERPVTEEFGSNKLVGTDPKSILNAVRMVLDGPNHLGIIPPLWDGRAAERIGDVLGGWHGRRALTLRKESG